MMKIKRLLSMGLALVMSVGVLCVPALGESSTATSEEPKISEEYAPGTSGKNGHDLTDEISSFISDFVVPLGNAYTINGHDEVQLGKVIPTYVIEENLYSQEHYNAAEVQYYPVFSGGSVIGLVGVAQDDSGDYIFSYSEGYSEQINSALTDNSAIALVGDGRSLEVVASVGQAKSTRVGLDFANPSEELSTIDITVDARKISKSNSQSVLQVPTKYQSRDWDCWAACVACVGQYYTGINKSSIQIADAVGIHEYAGFDKVSNAIQSIYNVSTTYGSGSLRVNNVMNTISYDKRPILSGVVNSGNVGHMVVINGWTLVGNQIALVFMDPVAGPTTATVSSDYPITIPLGGNMYKMEEYLI